MLKKQYDDVNWIHRDRDGTEPSGSIKDERVFD
jgi:hypothetical protein